MAEVKQASNGKQDAVDDIGQNKNADDDGNDADHFITKATAARGMEIFVEEGDGAEIVEKPFGFDDHQSPDDDDEKAKKDMHKSLVNSMRSLSHTK